jgi:valyl-tRNA synthetase
MIEKTYQPGEVEGRIYAAWEAAGAFRAGRPERAKAEPYCIVIPPPNVTGSLHMGHALNNTLQDILCRFERMRGKDVLWQPGTDHAGIATQAVVERQLAERKEPSSRAMGREAFIKRVWEWKAESGGTIISQLKRLGASCDWSRERFTMGERGDPNDPMVRAVIRAFVELYNTKGPDGRRLIYKDKRLVNWDPKLKTAISDLEVVQVETKGHLWYIKYPIEGSDEFIVVATTRPETMLGDVAVAVHPENEKLKHLIGKKAILPLVGRLIPIIGDDYADPEKGSGAVKITPAHDFNDFEVGKRHNLPTINVLDPEAHINIQRNPEFHQGYLERYFVRDVMHLDGDDRVEARKKIVEMLETRDLLDKVETTTHAVPHGDRSGAVVEPYLTDQWYVDAKTLAAPAIAAVREGKTVFVPTQWEATFFNWMENIQPWCISRQIWWGHQIPAWYGPKKNPDGSTTFTTVLDGGVVRPEDCQIFVEASETEAIRAAKEYYGKDVIVTKNAFDASWVGTGKNHIFRDDDVLDTWFSSALWPFSTLGWPDQTRELKRFYPTSTLVTGFDIIFFWVARMMMMGLHFMEEVPFRDVYIHRLVRDEKGAKMSKSKGNVIDPLGIIDDYGADALRFTLAREVSPSHDIKLAAQQVEGNRNFATKLWNAARFMEFNGCARDPNFAPNSIEEMSNRWIAYEVSKAGREVTLQLEGRKFGEAASTLYHFVWNIYCDWYLELIKPVLTGPDGAAKYETQAAAAWALDEILKLLHPFMPFVTEELWRVTAERGPERDEMLALAPWPDLSDLERQFAPYESNFDVLLQVISEARSIRTTYNVPFREPLTINLSNFNESNTSVLTSNVASIARLTNTTVSINSTGFVQWDPESSGVRNLTPANYSGMPTVQNFTLSSVIKEGTATISMPESFDVATARSSLAKEMAKADADIARVDAKLGNPNFVSRAPEEVVEEEKEKREEAQARKAKIAEALERLKASA